MATAMSTVAIDPLLPQNISQKLKSRSKLNSLKPCYLNFSPAATKRRFFCSSRSKSFCGYELHTVRAIRASSTDLATVETSESTEVIHQENFLLERTEKVEGRIFVRFDQGNDTENWQLTVGCSLPGKWILHWGVSYIDDVGSEWDQPPKEMWPSGSVSIKDYAIETLLKQSSSAVGGDKFQEVTINCETNSGIAAINFVLKDQETGAWYQHRGRDFKVPLVDYIEEDANVVRAKKGFPVWSGALGKLSNILQKGEVLDSTAKDTNSEASKQEKRQIEGFYEELPIVKEFSIKNSVSISVKKCPNTTKNLVYLETDLPGDVVVHWGVCCGEARKWEVPSGPHPPETTVFKNKALRTKLQPKDDGNGCGGLFALDEHFVGLLFVLKINESTWLNCKGNDFYIPLSSSKFPAQPRMTQVVESEEETSPSAYTDGIFKEIRNLVSDIASEKGQTAKTKEAQENILQEIEKLAAEAYSIFRSTIPTFSEEPVSTDEAEKPPVKISSGTGSGFEILCQGFNWESHKSGRWYMELKEKAAQIASLGFTVIWLPPPTDSVSPEGYMPTDLYNLNSRYGTIDELKDIVRTFHEVGVKVLGDVVLNHRCAQYKNKNGVWNIFGGRLNWDDRAVVADDPHFQGRGNKSSGDNFHAAPNIDHSQDFVRKDIKEWLHWLREEIGYDGWRLDFVRGFWGGYVKDYLDASEPYFAVGEYWDSLSYTYGEMDYNQDAHRQRIVDWINATNGTAGAFDVTTKGILHAALERCEYWRLSDAKGKPPGVVGWWPSRAVTFIENHDTGSTQGHWRFPGGKEMQGYTYILTHPGTPSVFFDHIFSPYQSEIASLISLRNRKKVHCRSMVKITKQRGMSMRLSLMRKLQ